jgi:transitional endoplasmic reticulum ATPase
MLEENPVPAFWLTNSLQCLDSAFIRRFDMVIELPVPPKNRRKAIIEKVADGMLPPRAIERLAECETITPAVVSRAASVIKAIKGRIDEKDAAPAIELIVGSTLKAQGHRPPTHHADQLAAAYDPYFINADIDLAEVAKVLARRRSGRLCLYGPSGTGKSAYGRWLADQIGVPLIVKRASDLISMWVGQSEKNTAAAFHEAECDGAILLIDEVDSFLADRRLAYHSWEISLVNEMLTQMEVFSGIFVACTNLMDWIDQAALRRFDIKAKFDFLNPTQAWELLCRSCAADGRGEPSLELRSRLSRLTNLTLGDFAVVARRTRFEGLESVSDRLKALEAESALKDGRKHPIGFVPS